MFHRILLCALLWFPSAPAIASWQGEELSLFGLMIGNNEGGDRLERLRYTHRDVERLKDVLYELGGMTPEHTRVLLEKNRDDLLEAMHDLELEIQQAKSSGKIVMLIFYYSGHAKDGHLLLGRSRLPMSEIKQWLEESSADVQVAFFDACQSGAMTRLKGGELAPSMVELEHTQGQIIITSSSASEGSQESDEIGGSFFTHYLTSGLRGAADLSGDGVVSLREAYDYTYNQTVNRTAFTRAGTQHPTYGFEVAGRGEIVLTRIEALSCGISFPAELAGEYLIYDLDKKQVIAELDKRAGEKRSIATRPGKYAVKKRLKTHLLLGEFNLARGQQINVEDQKLTSLDFEDDTTKGLWDIEEGISLVYSLRMGVETFFDNPTREDLFYTAFQGGFQIELMGLISRHLSLCFDALFGGGADDTTILLDNGQAQVVSATFFRMQIGAAMHYHLDWEYVGFYVGPRLTFLYTTRNLGEPLDYWPTQTFGTFSPGVSLGAVFHWGDFDLLLEGRAHYLYYNVDGDQSMGYGGVYLGVAYHP